MRIGVLMGGMSSEREISIRSGTAVYNALIKKCYNAVKIDVDRNIAGVLKKKKIDIAFIALHGKYGEDGTMQGLLEIMGMPHTGSSVMASSMAFDKTKAKEIFRFHNIPTPDWEVVEKGFKAGALWARVQGFKGFNLKLPVVVKPAREGSTIGLTVVKQKRGLQKALKKAGRYDDKIIVEKFILGRELTVGVLKGHALPIIEVKPKNGLYDYKSKYTKGMTEYICPAPLIKTLESRIKKIALDAYNALGCSGAARVDIMLDKKNRPYVLEVNTIPGMTELSLLPKAANHAGIDFPELVEMMLMDIRQK
ncbi:MAG: D-alanine--D-alanine ligase [Deltaproteobacteria bacterium]|nr:D-alanine--D-alanine ligase [Deltaproteobacteria bacterium]